MFPGKGWTIFRLEGKIDRGGRSAAEVDADAGGGSAIGVDQAEGDIHNGTCSPDCVSRVPDEAGIRGMVEAVGQRGASWGRGA